MSDVDWGTPEVQQQSSAITPAIGFIATVDNTDALVRSLLKAKRNGHRSLVTFTGESPPDGVELAKELDATVIEPEISDASPEYLRQGLVGAAKAYSEPGIIFAPLDCELIDFDRSIALLQAKDAFSVEAITQSEVDVHQNPGLLVAIPAYNESETIGDVVREAKQYADSVLVVDDGSDDNTADIARKAGAEVHECQQNQGYGQTIKTIFSIALDRNAQTLVILDADGQHEPKDIPKLANQLESADLAIGSRFVKNGESDLPPYRWFGLKVINTLTNLSMGVVRRRSWVNDTQSGFRAYSRSTIESLARDQALTDGMGISTDILHHAHEHDYDISEVGTRVLYSVDNASSHNPIRHGLTLVSNLFRTVERERPVTVFGLPGVLSTILGLGFGYWAVTNYISTSTFPSGLALSAVFFTLTGVLACFTAIILHSLTIHFCSRDA